MTRIYRYRDVDTITRATVGTSATTLHTINVINTSAIAKLYKIQTLIQFENTSSVDYDIETIGWIEIDGTNVSRGHCSIRNTDHSRTSSSTDYYTIFLTYVGSIVNEENFVVKALSSDSGNVYAGGVVKIEEMEDYYDL